MQITSLASGSGGNCTVLVQNEAVLLIDDGISMKRLKLALESLELCPEQISGILITHEHNDHISGLKTLIKHYEIPIFAPRTVANRLCGVIAGVEDYISELSPGREDNIEGFRVLPFRTPHDTPESVGYRITGDECFGFCTDCGHITDEVLEGLRGVDRAVIEANHDLEMLQYGDYPVFLKRRILADTGHLSNESSGKLAVELFKSGTRFLTLGHLSHQNNTPGLAMRAVSSALLGNGIDPLRDISLCVAPEKDIFSLPTGEGATC